MKKLILLVFFVLIYPSVIYAGNDEASPAAKSLSGYDPKCWNTHMVDQMAVCSKAHGSCANSCTKKDLKANALCLTECNNVLKVCYNKASVDYKICIEAEKQSKKQQETKELESKATQNKPSEAVNPFNIFTFNPLEIWRNIQGILDIGEDFPALLQSSQFLTESVEVLVEIPRPSIAFDPEGKPWDFLPGYVPHESIYLGNTMRISEGTKVSAGGVNQGNDKKLLNLEEGEVEVIKNELNVTDSEYDGIKTPNATVLSVQTHYWVSYDKKKNQTTVAIYEGKVEVKTKDGQVATFSPNGDPSADSTSSPQAGSGQVKPGVVVVAQKLSATKLAVAGLVSVIIFGGALFLLRRKFFLKKTGKKNQRKGQKYI